MVNELPMIGTVCSLGFLCVLLPIPWSAYHRYAHRLALTCPETGVKTAVQIDPIRAMWTSLIGEPKLFVGIAPDGPKRKIAHNNALEKRDQPIILTRLRNNFPTLEKQSRRSGAKPCYKKMPLKIQGRFS
jgi:hypothetical protein